MLQFAKDVSVPSQKASEISCSDISRILMYLDTYGYACVLTMIKKNLRISEKLHYFIIFDNFKDVHKLYLFTFIYSNLIQSARSRQRDVNGTLQLDQVSVMLINILCTLQSLFKINFLNQLLNVYLLKENKYF